MTNTAITSPRKRDTTNATRASNITFARRRIVRFGTDIDAMPDATFDANTLLEMLLMLIDVMERTMLADIDDADADLVKRMRAHVEASTLGSLKAYFEQEANA